MLLSYLKTWEENEVRTTREIATALNITRKTAYKLCCDATENGWLSRYGYRVRGGWEDPDNTTRQCDSLGWQVDKETVSAL